MCLPWTTGTIRAPDLDTDDHSTRHRTRIRPLDGLICPIPRFLRGLLPIPTGELASHFVLWPFRFTLLRSVTRIFPGEDGLHGSTADPAVVGFKSSEPGHGVNIRSAGLRTAAGRDSTRASRPSSCSRHDAPGPAWALSRRPSGLPCSWEWPARRITASFPLAASTAQARAWAGVAARE